MSANLPQAFKGAAKRLTDIDIVHVGSLIGVGEDELHAVLDVESRGHGFDAQGRPIILFEPHIFFRQLSGTARDNAVRLGVAYQNWGEKPYPADSYPRLEVAMKIDEAAALKSASWGLGQLLGSNFAAAGYATVQDMVIAFCDGEEQQLAGMTDFIKASRLDGFLRAHSWASFARGYNGPGFAKNEYDTRLARRFEYWSKIKDTAAKPYSPIDGSTETRLRDPVSGHVVGSPATPASIAPITQPADPTATPITPASLPTPAAPSFWARFFAALIGRLK